MKNKLIATMMKDELAEDEPAATVLRKTEESPKLSIITEGPDHSREILLTLYPVLKKKKKFSLYVSYLCYDSSVIPFLYH